MGYISVSGIGFAVRTLALVAFATMSVAATEPASTLDLSITGLRSTKGMVLICVTANPALLSKCDKDPAAHKLTLAASKAGHVAFTGMAPGTYAVALIHDENSNSKLDTMFAMPREGFGFSRNPAIRFGPPKFTDASFKVDAGVAVSQAIKLKYML